MRKDRIQFSKTCATSSAVCICKIRQIVEAFRRFLFLTRMLVDRLKMRSMPELDTGIFSNILLICDINGNLWAMSLSSKNNTGRTALLSPFSPIDFKTKMYLIFSREIRFLELTLEVERPVQIFKISDFFVNSRKCSLVCTHIHA